MSFRAQTYLEISHVTGLLHGANQWLVSRVSWPVFPAELVPPYDRVTGGLVLPPLDGPEKHSTTKEHVTYYHGRRDR